MKNLLKTFCIILIIAIFSSCEDKPTPPVITTTTVSDIATNSAVSGGSITSTGGADIVSKGICWNISDNPTIDNNQTNETGGTLSFSCTMLQLLPSTTYYVRAYATNSAGTSYGNSISFKTLGDKPTPTAQNASNIQLTSATINGTVNPNLIETTVTFEYGTTTNYGSNILAQQNPLSGDSDKTISVDLIDLNPGTNYHFRVKAENSLGINYSSDMMFTTLGSIPSATVESATNLQYNTVTIKMSVNPNYFQTTGILEYGPTSSYGNSISITQNPLTGKDPITLNVDLSGLTQGTMYHLRITATNQLGISNSNDFTFTTLAPISDIDGNVYNIKTIGSHIWMTENLKTTKYNNGDLIGTTSHLTLDISNENMPKYQWAYEGNESYAAIYGRLYTGYVVTDPRKVCPSGWHIPSDAEWTTLTNYLINNGHGYEGSGDDIGKSMAAISLWAYNSTPGNVGNDLATNNKSGFSALPSGYRSNDDKVDGIFVTLNWICSWWSSTDLTDKLAWQRIMQNQFNNVTKSYIGGKRNGISVRCIRD